MLKVTVTGSMGESTTTITALVYDALLAAGINVVIEDAELIESRRALGISHSKFQTHRVSSLVGKGTSVVVASSTRTSDSHQTKKVFSFCEKYR